jgi:hypothetical protein
MAAVWKKNIKQIPAIILDRERIRILTEAKL